jgi:hypothetical protein
MAFEYVDRAFLIVDSEEIADATKIDVTPSRDSKVIKTLNRRNRGRGFSKGQPHWELSAEVVIPAAGEYDWRKAFRDAIPVTVTIEEASGRRILYPDTLISDVSSSYQVEGESRRTIKMLALDEIDESA